MIYQPTFLQIKKYEMIYDVSYNQKYKLIILIAPFFKYFDIFFNGQKLECIQCPHHHTLIYLIRNIEYQPNINIMIYNKTHNLRVNKYPVLTDKMIISTNIKNESNVIEKWISYYKKHGVDQLLIYDNNSDKDHFDKLIELQKKWDFILIKWPYKKRFTCNRRSGISGQTTRENHSIWTFREASFMFMIDVDEYFVPQITVSPDFDFRHFCNAWFHNKWGGYRIRQLAFGNPHKKDETNFFDIFDCEKNVEKRRQRKNIIIPRNVQMHAVHKMLLGKPIRLISEKIMHMNHYKFLNKPETHNWRRNLIHPSTNNKIIRYL